MSDEIRVSSTLTVTKRASDGTVLIQRTLTKGFTDDMAGAFGPAPGSVLAETAENGGTLVNFGSFTRPTWVWLENQGPVDGSAIQDSDHVTFGIWNAQDTSFHPIGELAPGEGVVIKLSRDIQEVYQGPGSGTAGAGETARLMLIAYARAQNFYVGAFEK